MKFPNHIILDSNINHFNIQNKYWIFTYFYHIKNVKYAYKYPFIFKKYFFFQKKILNNKLNYQIKFTLKYNLTESAYFLSKKNKIILKKILIPKLKIKSRKPFKKNFIYQFYFFFKKNIKFNINLFKRIYLNKNLKLNYIKFNTFNEKQAIFFFLKKEQLYTKLKYSRTPQYDIVSGGIAALFAGFLGFLICEKFGFELLDSGDFYFLFMYLVFFSFFLRLIYKLNSINEFSWSIISIKWLLNFIKIIVYLILNKFK